MCPSSSGDRASASGAESRRFESYLGHHSDFPRTRMMRVFFFSARNSSCLPPIAEHAAALSHKKASPHADSLGRGVHTFRPMYCREPYPTDASCRFCSFCFFRRICDDSHRHAPEPTKATALKRHQATSSDRLISRNGLQQAAWRCSQSHRRRTTRRAPRYRCSRD